jgi:hypothetical protein
LCILDKHSTTGLHSQAPRPAPQLKSVWHGNIRKKTVRLIVPEITRVCKFMFLDCCQLQVILSWISWRMRNNKVLSKAFAFGLVRVQGLLNKWTSCRKKGILWPWKFESVKLLLVGRVANLPLSLLLKLLCWRHLAPPVSVAENAGRLTQGQYMNS